MKTHSILAERLIAARRGGEPIGDVAPPASIADAMEDQRRVADALSDPPAGWKIAIHPEHGPVAAPLLASLTRESPAALPANPALLIEVEVAIRLRRDISPAHASRGAIIDSIDSIGVGVELVGARLAAGGRAPFLSFLADNLGNAGYVIGSSRRAFDNFDLGAARCDVRLDGETLHAGDCAHPQGDPLAPLIAYAVRPTDRLGGLRAGQIITTGSVCGALPLPGAGRLVASIDGLGAVEILFS